MFKFLFHGKPRSSHISYQAFKSTSPTANKATMSSNPRVEEVKDIATAQSNAADAQQSEQQTTPLPLPAPSDEEKKFNLDMSSGAATASLDHLGPLVVNQDGTLSRIANWDQMADVEKKNTLRILGKRNQLRRAGLEEQGAGEEGKQ